MELVRQDKLTFALVAASKSFFSSCSSLSICLIISAVDLGFKLSFSELYSRVKLEHKIQIVQNTCHQQQPQQHGMTKHMA
jgi:hypothetical protein